MIKTKNFPAAFRPSVALTVPSPWWWFLLSGIPLKQIESVAGCSIIPAGIAYRGTLYIHASCEFTWGIVRDDALSLIRDLGWRRTPSKWPSMFAIRASAGRIVGEVAVRDSARGRGFTVSPLSVCAPTAVCADGAGLFSLSSAVLSQLRKEVAA